MRAIVIDQFGPASVLQIREIDPPRPGPGEVAIKVALTGVNFADIMIRRGGYGRAGLPPLTPGLDCVGTVIEIGAGVTDIRVGQRVAAFPVGGAYAEIVVAKATLTYVLPDAVSDDDASALTMLVTAYNCLTLAGRMLPGETVLIHAGAGGVGSIAIQLAKCLGAGRVVATVGSAAKLAFAKAQGADIVINYRDQEIGASLHSATSGTGVDLILDSVIGPVFEGSFAALAPFGRYIVYGASSGEAAQIATGALHQSSRSVIGYSTGSYRRHRPEALRPAVNAVLGHVAQGDVRVPIGGRFALADTAAAHEFVEGRTSTGKIVIEVGSIAGASQP